MERRYYYARAVGNPQLVLGNIVSAVEKAGLAAQIPLVKLERKARGEFYVFLAVDEMENRGIPGSLGQTLQHYGISFDEDYPLKPADIRSMVQRQEIEIHGFKTLKYRRRNYEDPGDPFERSDAWNPQEASPEACACYERLLSWISVCGEGSWETFSQACKSLGVASNNQEARSGLRRLTLLGHIDTNADGSRWSVSPACLVRFPCDPSSGFLSGQRTSEFLCHIGNSWSLKKSLQSYYPGPPRMILDLRDRENADVSAEAGVVEAGTTSTQLAELLPDLNGWKDTLQSITDLDIGSYQVESWKEGTFQSCGTFYNRDGVYFGPKGMYRLSRKADTSGRTVTMFFDEPEQRLLRGDWYGLRFLSLEADGSGVEGIHDSGTEELLIPASQRWPLLYERALTLASGLLPGRAENPNWLSYSCVPVNLARTLCDKLNVNLKEE